jgi:hypothetical protein
VKQFQRLIDLKNYNRARKALTQLEEYTASKGLFLPPPLKEQFREILPIIRRALISVETSVELEEYKIRREAGDALATAEPVIQSIEKEIGERLQSHARK